MVSFSGLVTAALLAASAVAIPHDLHHRHHSHKRSGGKRGAAYNQATLVKPISQAVTWAYDWNMFTDGTLPSGVEFVPMLWGSKMFGGWTAAIETALSTGSSYILGFNEPDNAGQANMSPEEAASSYQNYITPYASKATLISPAVTNSGAPNQGLDWLKSFMGLCANCGVSGLAVHWYGESAEDFKNFVSNAIDTGKQYGIDQIWVTEFALNDAINGLQSAKSAGFLEEVLPWLDSQPSVARYAYFMCADGFLLSGNGLSTSGQIYTS